MLNKELFCTFKFWPFTIKGFKMRKDDYISGLKSLVPLGWADPYIPFTHAYHESGNFAHVIGGFNFWGIKKPRTWNGLTALVNTHEYDATGKKYSVTAEFIDFRCIEEALAWYDNFISRLYKISYSKRDSYKEYFTALVSDPQIKYATDPKYTDKLIALYETLKNNRELEGRI